MTTAEHNSIHSRPYHPVADSAVIFDLDGTITKPLLNFDAIRMEIGIASGPILEAVATLRGDERVRAEQILNRHERDAAHAAELYEGAAETLAQLRAWGHRVAVMTRNARPWAQVVIDRFRLRVDLLRTREDGVIKPSPEPVHHICRHLRCSVAYSWVIGDYLFDIQSGKSAGARTVLMIGAQPVPDYAALADHTIRELPALLDIIRTSRNEKRETATD